MTEAERAHAREWDAWNRLSLAEQAANLDKIDATREAHGPQAARDMARAVGLPFPLDELADPDDVLAVRRAEGDQWIRDMLTRTGLLPVEIEELLQPKLPDGPIT